MPRHSEIGQSKSLFLLTVALLCFQAKKLPFSHGNGHSDWLTEWLFLYNYRIICRLANTKDLKSVQSALSDLMRPPERLQSQCNYRPFIT